MRAVRLFTASAFAILGVMLLGKPAMAEGGCAFLEPGICATYYFEVCIPNHGCTINHVDQLGRPFADE